MLARDTHFIAALNKATALLDGCEGDACGINKTTARLAIDEAIANIKTNKQLGVTTVALLEVLTVEIQALKKELRVGAMAPVVAIGRAKLDHYPELALLRMPSQATTVQNLIRGAYAMANSVALFEEAYAGESLSTSAAQSIRDRADALRAALDRRRALTSQRVGATWAIRHEIERARSEFAVLDAFVKARLSGNASFMLKWLAIRLSA